MRVRFEGQGSGRCPQRPCLMVCGVAVGRRRQMAKAVEVVRSRRQPDGRWLLDASTRVASTSTLRAAWGRRAAGTPSARSGCSTGGTAPPDASREDEPGPDRQLSQDCLARLAGRQLGQRRRRVRKGCALHGQRPVRPPSCRAGQRPDPSRAPHWRGAGLRLDQPGVLLHSPPARSPCAPPSSRRNARRPTFRCGPGAAPRCCPPAGLPDAGWARHPGRLPAPPGRPKVLLLAPHPTSGCAPQSGADTSLC